LLNNQKRNQVMKKILFSPLMLLVLVTGCASSTHQVTGVKRPSFPPEAVGIYSSMPAHAEVIGFVSANSYDGMTLHQANKDALSMLKTEAGKLGANGVVIL